MAASVQTEPAQMLAPTEGLLTNEAQIHLEWLAQLSEEQTHGSEITSYHLRWDAGTNGIVYIDVVGLVSDSIALDFVISNDITPGEFYLA